MAKVNQNNSDVGDSIKIKLETALSLNRQMQQQLNMVREKLEKLLNNVKDNYKVNDVLLKEGLIRRRKKGIGIKGAYLKGGTFYLKGNMFFKDIKCRNCPNNPDYERRKSQENELFPMDLELQGRHIWSTKDKQGVVVGIKEQIIDYLKRSSKKLNIQRNEIDSEKLVKLLNIVPKDFSIDWDHISSYNVQHRHSAQSCEAIWNVFLNPRLRRSAWSDEENKKLLEASKKYNLQNWEAIAQEVGQRSDFQNYVCYMLPELRSSKWTKEDDQRLLDVVAKNTIHGVINWSNVMAYFPHKPKTTLQSRYAYSLNPEISHAPFTPEEDLLLLAAVKEYGTKFNCLPRNLFPNRTVVQLRSRYKNTLLNRHKWHPWTLEDDLKLMEFVTRHGTKSWLECSKFLLGKHTRTSCRTRFLTVKKFLEKNPDANLETLPRKSTKRYGCINAENWKEKLRELTENPKADFSKPPSKKKSYYKSKKPKDNSKHEKLSKPEKPSQPKKPNQPGKPSQPENPSQPEKPSQLEKLSKPEKRKKRTKQIIPYIARLQANGLKNYNFFKYSYNFKIDQDPCGKISPNVQTLTIVMSTLNPQISRPLEKCQVDASIPIPVRPNINTALKETTNYQVSQLLPPNWSSAIGFRALCIHAACNDREHVALPVMDDSNDHIKIFRERLRSLFYSSALLSRLHPNMISIRTESEFQTNEEVKFTSILPTCCDGDLGNITLNKIKSIQTRKRPRSSSEHENDNKATSKNICIETIKTELES